MFRQKRSKEGLMKITREMIEDFLKSRNKEYATEESAFQTYFFVNESVGRQGGTAFRFDRYGNLEDVYVWE